MADINAVATMLNKSSTLIDSFFQSRIVAHHRARAPPSKSKQNQGATARRTRPHVPRNRPHAPRNGPHGVAGGVRPQKYTRATACNCGATGQRSDPPETLTLLPPLDSKKTRRYRTQDLNRSTGTTPRACAIRGTSRPTREREASLRG